MKKDSRLQTSNHASKNWKQVLSFIQVTSDPAKLAHQLIQKQIST